MHTFNGFNGTETFCDGMADDLEFNPSRYMIKIHGKKVMRPSKESQKLNGPVRSMRVWMGECENIAANKKRRRACDKWRMKSFAQIVLGNAWASDNERELANRVLDTI